MLEARNITIKYESCEVVVDVSLKAAPRTMTAIIGANGAGKSTLLCGLNGTLSLSGGEILLDGKPLGDYARRSIGRHIAVVAQENEVKFPVTALEFVLSGRFAHSGHWGWENERDVTLARDALRDVQMQNYEARLMNQLSGGERQRVVLARALATEAEIFLLDEPTANLDLQHQALTLAVVRARCLERGAAAIVVTHDLNLAAEFADQILLLRNGRAHAYGTPAEVLTPENLFALFNVEVLIDAHPLSNAPRITPVHGRLAAGGRQ